MALLGDLLVDVLGARPQPVDEPDKAATSSGFNDTICSGAGTSVLARHDVDLQDALRVADLLGRQARLSNRAITVELGLPEPLVRRIRTALTRIPGLEGLGRSWAPDVAPGQLARIATWGGCRRWLLAVSCVLLSPKGKAEIAKQHSSRPLIMRVAREDAASADGRSGRGVRTSHATVARRLSVAPDAVRHARYVLEALGLSVTVVQGRYLTANERAAAAAYHGGRQRRIASTRALTLPRKVIAMVARHLPRSGSDPLTPTDSSPSPRRAGKSHRRQTPRRRPPIALPWQRLAAQVAQILPRLAETHIGNLARGLSRTGIDPDAWTGHQLVRMVELRNINSGWLQPACVRSELRLFLHQVAASLATAPSVQGSRLAE